jgi:glycopeptide antibiotics resistance protein
MPSGPAKKQFPGIFVIIAVSFIVYLAIVTWVIMVHYKKPAKPSAIKVANKISVTRAPAFS